MAEHTKACVSNVILEITLIKDIKKRLKISAYITIKCFAKSIKYYKQFQINKLFENIDGTTTAQF